MRELKTVTMAVAGVLALTLAYAVLRGRIAMASNPSVQDDVHELPRVSGSSPFQADCNGATFPISAAYINAEVEPYVAINPKNPNNLIAVYQQDRYPDDGANGVLAAVSMDGGRSWQVPTLQYQPVFSRCAGVDGAHRRRLRNGERPVGRLRSRRHCVFRCAGLQQIQRGYCRTRVGIDLGRAHVGDSHPRHPRKCRGCKR